MIVNDRGAAAVLFHSLFRTLGDDVAEILDLCIGAIHIGRDVGVVGDRTATDDRHFDFTHS